MKKYALTIATLFIVAFTFAQGVKTQITSKTSVVFPSQPEKKEQGPVVQYTLVAKDSSTAYTVAVVDLEATNGLSAEALALAATDPTFWDQAESVFLGSVPDAKKLKREIRKVGSNEAMYIELERMMDGKKVLVSAMIMLEGKFSINLVHMDKTAGDAGREKFFTSLETTEAVKQ